MTRPLAWIADVPANWNGTPLLYSHGYEQDVDLAHAANALGP